LGDIEPVALRFDRQVAKRFAVTIAASAAGGFIADWLGMPAGWIAGGIVAVAFISLAGFSTDVPAPLRAPVYLVIGVYSGGGVSHQTLHEMQTWPLSFAILGVSLIGLIASSYWWLHGRCGWDRNAALLSSLPGALSFVMAAAEGLKTDMKKVAIAQSLRLLILVEVIPLLALLIGEQGTGPSDAPVLAGPLEIALLLVAGTAASIVLAWLKVPGGWMLGGLLASATLLLTGVVHGRVPYPLVLPFVVALAAITGSRFRPGDLAVLPHIAKPALVAFALASCVSLIGAACVSVFIGVSFIQALLAFAPGALDALVIIAFQMNIDPAYVAAHHVARFLAMVLLIPFLARWLARPSKGPTKT
jgi:hypothetical protein